MERNYREAINKFYPPSRKAMEDEKKYGKIKNQQSNNESLESDRQKKINKTGFKSISF